ncbi:MAG: hypothetical protein V4596_12990 [Bdellovibrionota bacterium]
MKYAILVTTLFALNSFAQTANIKDIQLDKEKETNISITTGDKKDEKKYEIVEESSDISGEPESLSKAARASWKKACDEWKAETKEHNKDSKIISLNCGTPKCEKSESVTTTCTSEAKLKVKVKAE